MAEKASARKTGEDRTRRLAEKPFEELDASAGRSSGDGGPSLSGAARSAAVTALAAAVAGALGGAAKAMLDRRDESDSNGATPPPKEEEQDAEEQQPESVAEPEDTDEEQDEDADAPLTRAEHSEADEQEEEPDERAGDADRPREQERGSAPNEVADVVERARRQLQEVLGEEAESVSGLDRSDGRWTVTLEVVEVRRIPESTDVLASYEVVLDDDGGIVSMQRRHRYRRSQVEEER